ncbi:MAG: ABC transporter ATP-binding protein [candidate division Zixibacteria bacterium]|nr:ABC transporter ATP-binding protein [candidate division Zixibacteria bacterium]MDH3936913.1 ABC transporter ATP-binding protein [candidate division Zixibacteria bacterium]MDH4033354.1 ABC transporter ATP-binding protein [candidate division Zixibacteria bacterium]
MFRLAAQDLAKRFGHRKLFKDLSFDLTTGDSLAVTGSNGSGKSTLMITLLGLQRPTRGKIIFSEGDTELDDSGRRRRIAFVSPYFNLYDHLTAEENLTFFATVSGGSLTGKEINSVMERVGLKGRGMDLVAEFSSGMKQRLKYALAVTCKPDFLFLDEPTSNLDSDGKKLVFEIVEQMRSDSIMVIATNEEEEYRLATAQCRLG